MTSEVTSGVEPARQQPGRGVRFGRLTVLRLESTKKGRRIWRCVCDCGKHRLVATRLLTRGQTRSCGCLCRDVLRQLGAAVIDKLGRGPGGRFRKKVLA